MTAIKRQTKPIIFVFLILFINASLWIYYTQAAYFTNDVIQTSLMGSSLLMGFMIVFLLSTRMRIIVNLFGGLENVYVWHRILAILTTLSIFAHGYFASASGLINIPEIFLIGRANKAGELARNLFIFLIVFALFAKYMKYEHFRYIHRLLIIPYLIALYHGFFSSVFNLFSFNLLSIWMIVTSIIGIGASIYMILIYQRTAFSYQGKIVDQVMLNEDIIELKIQTNAPYQFMPGQFAFIKIFADGFSKDPHPFSISGYDGEYLYFTIKALGDFTNNLSRNLTTPAKIHLTKPFGSMTFHEGHKQMWVVGGIGITPFLGYLRTNDKIDKSIDMIYSVKTIDEAVHLKTLNELSNQHQSFNYQVHDVSKKGFMTLNELSIVADTVVYMCGPRTMVMSIKNQIKQKHPHVKIIYEAFSFTGTLVEDLIQFIKNILKRIKKKT